MADFFTDIDTLKDYVSVTKGLDIDSIGPSINRAARKYIIPVIGKTFYDELLTAFGSSPTAAQTDAITKIQTALAAFGTYLYIPEGEVILNDAGVMRSDSQHQKTAYAKQVQQLRDSLIESGYEALEDLLEFLEDNEADYPTWVSSDEYTLNKSNLINNAKTFGSYYNLKQGRQTFRVLFTTLVDVEVFYIIPVIGQDYYDELITQIQAKSVSGDNSKVLNWIRAAVANLTISEAVKKEWVSFTDGGVVFKEHSTASNTSMVKTGTNDQVSLKIRQAEDIGNRYLSKVKSFLDDNLATYTTYADDETVNPTEEVSTEECTQCDCGGSCSCTTSSGGSSGGFYSP